MENFERRDTLKTLACAFTGHRPTRYRFGYDEEHGACKKLKAVLNEQVAILVSGGITTFYTGMALGADTWLAEIVLETRQTHPKVQLIAVLPCETQANRWSAEQRERYFDILASCDDVVTLATHYTKTCMQERNRYMVDRADYLLAVYDNEKHGGTAYTVRYAQKKGRKIISIHPDTLEIVSAADLEAIGRRGELRIYRGKVE